MVKKIKKCGIKALSEILTFLIIFSLVSYANEQKTEIDEINNIAVFDFENAQEAVNSAVNVSYIKADVGEDEAVLKLFGIIPVKKISVNRVSTENICIGGKPFGIKLFTKGVIVVGLTDILTAKGTVCPASEAGIKKGDIILSVNGKEVISAENFGKMLSECGSKGAVLHCQREETEFDATVLPAVSVEDNKYKVGLWVRDSTAGIGTVTFIDKKTGVFGGLGHGVCDVDTGMLMPLERGTFVDVNVTGVIKGEPHTPGELRGSFMKEKKGELLENFETGVFGKVYDAEKVSGEIVQIGAKEKVTEGKIQIYTTINGFEPQKYDAEIVKIFEDSGKTKNFMIKVTDEKLLEKTGGIVQGMSGSPILQNEKLIGAVTHVLINNPEKGYGIFIENMLESANSVLNDENKTEHKNAA